MYNSQSPAQLNFPILGSKQPLRSKPTSKWPSLPKSLPFSLVSRIPSPALSLFLSLTTTNRSVRNQILLCIYWFHFYCFDLISLIFTLREPSVRSCVKKALSPPMMWCHVIFPLVLQYTLYTHKYNSIKHKILKHLSDLRSSNAFPSPRTTGPPPHCWSYRTHRSRAGTVAPVSPHWTRFELWNPIHFSTPRQMFELLK